MEGASASGQLAWPPHRGNRHSGGEEYGRHGDSAASDESVHTRRRYTVAVSAAALIAAVCCVTAFMSEPQTSTTTLEEVRRDLCKCPFAVQRMRGGASQAALLALLHTCDRWPALNSATIASPCHHV
eukprot:3708851-Rhodomonas_salina.2